MLRTSVVLCICLQYVIAVRSIALFGLQRVCLCRCGVSTVYSNSRTGRFTNELSVAPHEYPWLAAVNIGSQDLVVAGSLISDRHVLTAASPIYGLTPDRIIVTLGAHDRCAVGGSALNVTVEAITVHPGYSTINQENDLALIKLKHVVAFTKYVSPICLPIFASRASEQVTWTVGWSQTNVSCMPRVAVLPTLSAATCLKDDDNKVINIDKGCLGPLGVKSVICKTDVGAPVMARWSSSAAFRLIGVISTSSCIDTSVPLYTRISDHVGWIYEYIRRDCLCF